TEPIINSKGIKPPLFTNIAYDLTTLEAFNRLIGEGYLCKLVPKRPGMELNLSGVGVTAGEFNLQDLQAAVDREEITKRAIDETIACAAFESRKRWLIF